MCTRRYGRSVIVFVLLFFFLLCAGFDIRIEAYPDSAQRLNFARTYLASAAFAAKLVDTNADGGSSDGASPMRSVGGGISFTDPGFAAALAAVDATNEATSLAHEAHCYELAAHLTWSIWGVCQVCLIPSSLLRLVALILFPHSMSALLLFHVDISGQQVGNRIWILRICTRTFPRVSSNCCRSWIRNLTAS